jgi:hypothetical protein
MLWEQPKTCFPIIWEIGLMLFVVSSPYHIWHRLVTCLCASFSSPFSCRQLSSYAQAVEELDYLLPGTPPQRRGTFCCRDEGASQTAWDGCGPPNSDVSEVLYE